MIIRSGTKVRVRLRQDPQQVYDGVVQAVITPRGRRLEELDLRGPVARRTQVHCRVEFHAGLRICVLGGKSGGVRSGFDELWTFAPEPVAQARALALVEAARADPTRRAAALAFFRERVVELQTIAREYGDAQEVRRFAGDPEQLAAADLEALLAQGSVSPAPASEPPERSDGAA